MGKYPGEQKKPTNKRKKKWMSHLKKKSFVETVRLIETIQGDGDGAIKP